MTEKPEVRKLEDNELEIVAGGRESLGARAAKVQATLLRSNNDTINQIVQKMG